MDKKLKAATLLVAASILLILVVQYAYISRTYRDNIRRYQASIESALTYALVHNYRNQCDSVTTLLSERLAFNDSVEIRIQSYDHLTIVVRQVGHPGTADSVRHVVGEIELIYFPGRMPDNRFERSRAVLEGFRIAPTGCREKEPDSARIARIVREQLTYLSGIPGSFRIDFYCRAKIGKSRAGFPIEYTAGQHLSVPGPAQTGRMRYEPAYWGCSDTSVDRSANLVMTQSAERAAMSGIGWSMLIAVVPLVLVVFAFFGLLNLVRRQRQLAEMRDAFINNMTHELKTPIATISAAIEGMQRFDALKDKDRTDRYLETSRQELARLDEIVSSVLNLTAYQRDNIEPDLQPLNTEALITGIIEAEKLKTEKTARISFSIGTGAETIVADPVHFRNVLANLLNNAIKYSDAPVEVSIDLQIRDREAVFSVKDKGIGIPPAEQGRVFEKFHRVSTPGREPVKGTGLGLSYVKYIVELHRGSIGLVSEPGKGSEFIVSIPLSNAKD